MVSTRAEAVAKINDCDGFNGQLSMMRKVLVLTHGFLPWGGAASERIAMFCRHLPTFGWHPLVLCASENSRHLFDEPEAALSADGYQCWRVPDHTTWPLLRSTGKAAVAWARISQILLSACTGFPDAYRLWSERCKPVASEICQKEQPDVLLSTSPPHSIHLLAHYLHHRYGIPWVMDLRDAWLGNRRARFPTPLHCLISTLQYRRMIRETDAIVANSDVLGQMVASHLDKSARKVTVITNGFEESFFDGITPWRLAEPPTCVVLYSGGTYGGFATRTMTVIGHALEKLTQPGEVMLFAAGELEGVPDGAGRCGPIGIGHQSLTMVPRLLVGADILLLVMPSPEREKGSGTVFLKSYGYLRSGKPIIYIGPENASWDLLVRFPGTYRHDWGEWSAIANTLVRLCRDRVDWTRDRIKQVSAFSWFELTRRLVDLFNAMTASK